MLFPLVMMAASACNLGCGSGILNAEHGGVQMSMTPSTAAIHVGGNLAFAVAGVPASTICTWSSSASGVLEVTGPGEALGKTPGAATISAACGNTYASAAISVTTGQSGPIRITKGGTYTGNWESDDPNTPAVTITTNDPVVITDSTVTGRGTLIQMYGNNNGGNLTVTNTTGVGLDPMVAGKGRGSFLGAEQMANLTVQNCTMRGTAFGVNLYASTMASLNITKNIGIDLDDRVSDGAGGTILNQRLLGHFIILNTVSLPKGGEIAWNQVIDSADNSSIEDIINIFQSHGKDDTTPLRIHDNYLEGGLAVGYTIQYNGSGIQFDGATNDPALASGFVEVTHNVVVREEGAGITIAAGHDISITANRVVSCGQDGTGHWDDPYGNAFGMWNNYKTQQFFNNTISGNTGGMVVAPGGKPAIADLYVQSGAGAFQNTAYGNNFDDPCWVNGVVSQAAESTERSAWLDRVAQSGQVFGDTH